MMQEKPTDSQRMRRLRLTTDEQERLLQCPSDVRAAVLDHHETNARLHGDMMERCFARTVLTMLER